jgi:hypothetical protein
VSRFFSILGASAFGWLGWKAGEPFGLLASYFASVIGTAAGVVIGRRLAENLLE